MPGYNLSSRAEHAEEAQGILESLTGSFWYRIGRETATAYIRRKEWLYRRVESIEFVGRRSLHRHISIDFERPEDLPDLKDRAPADGCTVPVSIFTKWPPSMELDFRGPRGESLSIYKRTTNMQLDFGLLNGMAEEIGLKLDEYSLDLARDLALMVATNTPPALLVEDVSRDLRVALEPLTRPSDPWREAQITDIMDLAAQLANSSILWAPISARRGEDCIVKFSYLDSYGGGRPLRQLLIACSWSDRVVTVPLTHAGRYTRYHADVRTDAAIEFVRAVTRVFPANPASSARNAPDISELPPGSPARDTDGVPGGLEFSHEALGLIPSLSERLRDAVHDWRRRAPWLLGGRSPALPHSSSTRDDPVLSLSVEKRVRGISEIVDRRIHVYHPPRTRRSHRIILQLELSASREGFISYCLVMAIVLALVMSVTFAELQAAAESLSGLVVLLAAVPLVLGYLLVRAEDPLEREGIIGVRLMAIASGVMPLFGALVLVLCSSSSKSTGPRPDLAAARPVWAGLTILSWMITIGLGWSWGMAASRPRARPREHRVQNIASVSALVCALSLVGAGILDALPYHLATRQIAGYLLSHEVAVIAASALLVVGASALHATIGGLRRRIRFGRRGRAETLANILLSLAGGVWIWGTTFAGILVAWETVTIKRGAPTAPMFAVALTMLDAMLIPMAIVILGATVWIMARRSVIIRQERMLGDPWLVVAGAALAAPPLLLRAGSVVSYPSIQVAPGAAWVGFALWLLCLAALVRDPIKDVFGLRPVLKESNDPDYPDDPDDPDYLPKLSDPGKPDKRQNSAQPIAVR